MELTYENMMEHTQRYFDIIKTINPKKDPQIHNKVREFFSSDFEVRWGTPPKFNSRDEWVDHLCGHADQYIAHVLYEPDPFYIFVDDRKKMAACFVKEEMRDPVTEKLLKVFLLNVHYVFTMENNAVKFKWELISHIPAKYSSDICPE